MDKVNKKIIVKEFRLMFYQMEEQKIISEEKSDFKKDYNRIISKEALKIFPIVGQMITEEPIHIPNLVYYDLLTVIKNNLDKCELSHELNKEFGDDVI